MGLISELLVKLGWDGTAFKRGLAETQVELDKRTSKIQKQLNDFTTKQAKSLGKGLLGGVSVYGAVRGFEAMAEAAAQITKESQKLGVSTEQFQAIAFAAKETGMSVEDIAQNLKDLPPNVRAAMEAFRGMAIDADTVSGLTRADKNITRFKQYGFKSAGALAGAYNWAGETVGKGITNAWAYIQKALGNEDYAAELSATTLADPRDEEEIQRRQMRLFSKRQKRSLEDADQGRVVGKFSTMLDYELLMGQKKKQDTLSAIIRQQNFTGVNTQDNLNKIGGFNGGSDREALMNIYQRQIDLLERIAKALETDQGGPNV